MDYKIRVVVRNPNNAIFLKIYGKVGQIEIVRGDISNSKNLLKFVNGVDTVVNCVAIFYETNSQKFNKIHVESVESLANVCRDCGVNQLIHISSLGADINSESAILRTKGLGEEKILKNFPSVNTVRPSLIFGPEDNFFNRFGRLAVLSPVIPSVGSKTKFQPVFVGDVAKAVSFLVKNKSKKRCLELGGKEVYSFYDLLKKLLYHTNRKNLVIKVPFFAAKIMALLNDFLRLMTGNFFPAFLTVAQVNSLMYDNVCGDNFERFEDLGIEPKGLDIILPKYLGRFKKKHLK
jgi:NADH dehydrogenase